MREKQIVLILGVDIHGEECADIIARCGQYQLMGYVSDQPNPPKTLAGYPVFTEAEADERFPTAGMIPLHVWKSSRYQDRWVTLIDPSAVVSSTAQIGKGCIIYPQCFIGAKARLGDGVFMLSGGVVNHDCVIGERSVLTTRVTLAGVVQVGASAYLGQSCTIRQYLKIGASATIGMGAVVVKDVAEGVTVIGNPARPYIKK